MTGPMDARTKAYIDKAVDEKVFGMESMDIQETVEGLESRLASLELLDFQQQVNTLTQQISDINATLLGLRRLAVGQMIRVELHWMLRYINDTALSSPQWAWAAGEATRIVREIESRLQGQIVNHAEPETIPNDFDRDCRRAMAHHGFGNYFFPPEPQQP